MNVPDSGKITGNTKLTGVLEDDVQLYRKQLEPGADVQYNPFTLQSGRQGYLILIEGMTDELRLQSDILEPLNRMDPDQLKGWNEQNSNGKSGSSEDLFKSLSQSKQLRLMNSVEESLTGLCKGETVVLLDGCARPLMVALHKWEQRSIEEPAAEPTIRGARDGFTESMQTNMTLIRRRLATPDLKVEALQTGRVSKTDIKLVYLESIIMPGLKEEARQRISRIDIDAIVESGCLEELICDNAFSVFPQLINTERPDRVVTALLEGRLAIVVNNTPFVLIAPSTFSDSLHAAEDDYQNYLFASFARLLRFFLSLCALLLPSVYISLITFHQEMMPSDLLLGIAASREAVPFPALVEALLMEVTFEGLREAGIRLPKPVGQAVSIVGALVIGQAAVQAGIVSATLVIIVSFTGIASFIFPIYSQGLAFRLLRFPMMFLAAVLGLYGIFLGLLMLLIHLMKLRSFGVPYFAPIMPFHPEGTLISVLRLPKWAAKNRPIETAKSNRKRIKDHMRPHPPATPKG
ncbi:MULTISPECIES: spore germination protein [Paenibacillus]|uniref:Spore germination protein n=2 Tax=Paenibacillus TaxID=44249 RepID=A0A920CG61_9BACL|nr:MULTISPECIES: spore germination protein [Paenibacillus]MBU5673297.1 spore germination protein [Paenibacillus brevis]GIO38380.1 spore germination protein [Paenibacillus antibioticophila]